MGTTLNLNTLLNGDDRLATFNLAGRNYLILEVQSGDQQSLSAQAISSELKPQKGPQAEPEKGKRKYVYGLDGLSELLGCSKSTAGAIKRSGRIDGAVSQFGKTIVIDAELALELLRKK